MKTLATGWLAALVLGASPVRAVEPAPTLAVSGLSPSLVRSARRASRSSAQ